MSYIINSIIMIVLILPVALFSAVAVVATKNISNSQERIDKELNETKERIEILNAKIEKLENKTLFLEVRLDRLENL